MILRKQATPGQQKKWQSYFAEEHGVTIKNTEKLVLVTGHRRENFGIGFEHVCKAIKKIAKDHKDFVVVYPIHLNPDVQKPVKKILDGVKNINLYHL